MKKILLILSVAFLLTTGVTTFACPNKELHDGVQTILNIKDGPVYIKGKKLIVKGKMLSLLLLYQNNFDKEKTEEMIGTLGFSFGMYAAFHDLELEVLEDQ